MNGNLLLGWMHVKSIVLPIIIFAMLMPLIVGLIAWLSKMRDPLYRMQCHETLKSIFKRKGPRFSDEILNEIWKTQYPDSKIEYLELANFFKKTPFFGHPKLQYLKKHVWSLIVQRLDQGVHTKPTATLVSQVKLLETMLNAHQALAKPSDEVISKYHISSRQVSGMPNRPYAVIEAYLAKNTHTSDWNEEAFKSSFYHTHRVHPYRFSKLFNALHTSYDRFKSLFQKIGWLWSKFKKLKVIKDESWVKVQRSVEQGVELSKDACEQHGKALRIIDLMFQRLNISIASGQACVRSEQMKKDANTAEIFEQYLNVQQQKEALDEALFDQVVQEVIGRKG